MDKAAQLADFGDQEYMSMLCIEPANAANYVAGEHVGIPPGTTWSASQSISVRHT